MKTQTKNFLTEFYFGTLEDSQRLSVEKELLQDPEILLDYLDLKRAIEGATPVPQKPSPFLWRRLQPLAKKKVWSIALTTGLVAATIAGVYLYTSRVETIPAANNGGILFDAGGEHSFASDVL